MSPLASGRDAPHANATLSAARRALKVFPTDLPSVEAHTLTNRLYAAGGLRACGLIWYWQHEPQPDPNEWITLAADNTRIQIALNGNPVGLKGRALDWRAYTGDTRLLAWTAQHEPIIELLRAVFRQNWIPERFENRAAKAALLHSGFVQTGFDVRRTDTTRVVTGAVQCDANVLEALARRDDFCEPRPEQSIRHAWVTLPIVIDEMELTTADLAAIASGCIVRLDNRTLLTPKVRAVIPAGRLQLVAEITNDYAKVVGYGVPHMNQTHAAQTDAVASVPERGTSTTERVDVGALPVRLSFTAGGLTLPFAALSEIGPGYVFELDKRLDDQTITVLANDTPIARGELVAIGDLIGVRITRMLPKA